MKYFWIQPSVNNNEIGIFPQCVDAKNNIEIHEFGFGYYNRIIEKFTLPEPILRDQAKATNFLSGPVTSPVFLVIDGSFLNFLKKNSIQSFDSWNLIAHHKKSIINNYSLFHLCNPVQNRIINFDKSIFKIRSISNSNFEEIKTYKNYDNYHEHWKELIWKGYIITIENLFLDFSEIDFDLIRLIDIDTIGIGYYVSEKLKKEIEDQGFTGMEFKEIDEIDKKITVIY